MTGSPLHRPQATGEPTLAVAVSSSDLPLLALDVPVSMLSFALLGTSPGQTNRRIGRSGTHRGMYRPNRARLPRDTHPHGVGVPTRAATFPGTGLPRAGGGRNLTFVLSEVG
jgi:hypothetical protein